MMLRDKKVLQTAIYLSAFPQGVQASELDFGSLSFVFNGVAALGVLISALFLLLGYRLLVRDVGAKDKKSRVVAGGRSFNVSVTNAAPGVVIATFGLIGLVASLYSLAG
ncbi:hypothetical protein ACC688_28990 [Rhizobium ruizarguesonis]